MFFFRDWTGCISVIVYPIQTKNKLHWSSLRRYLLYPLLIFCKIRPWPGHSLIDDNSRTEHPIDPDFFASFDTHQSNTGYSGQVVDFSAKWPNGRGQNPIMNLGQKLFLVIIGSPCNTLERNRLVSLNVYVLVKLRRITSHRSSGRHFGVSTFLHRITNHSCWFLTMSCLIL